MAHVGTRTAYILVLATAMLMSLSGTSLAVTGISGSGSVGIAQYVGAPGESGDAPAGDKGGNAPAGDEGGNAPVSLGNPNPGGSDVQAASQDSVSQAGSGTLPFTGFLVIPLLVAGGVLLSAGLLLRRTSLSSPTTA